MSVLPAPARRHAALNTRTLEFSWYSDPGIYRREQTEIFGKSWLYAGPTHAVANGVTSSGSISETFLCSSLATATETFTRW